MTSCKTDILNYISKKNLSYESINNYFQKKENKNLLNYKSLMYLFDHCKIIYHKNDKLLL